MLEEIPDISYEDIGGLGDQIEVLRDSVELPYLHPEVSSREFELEASEGHPCFMALRAVARR